MAIRFELATIEEAAFIVQVLAKLPNESNAYMVFKSLEHQYNMQLQAASETAIEPEVAE